MPSFFHRRERVVLGAAAPRRARPSLTRAAWAGGIAGAAMGVAVVVALAIPSRQAARPLERPTAARAAATPRIGAARAAPEDAPAAEPLAGDDAEGGDDGEVPAASDVLGRADLLAGIAPIKRALAGCYREVPGTATVKLTITSSGRVIAAAVSPPFAGTAAGDCVAEVARTAVFRSSRRETTTLVWPFALRAGPTE